MMIYGGQYCKNFNERVRVTKELEKTYKSKVKIHFTNNFISYTAFTNDTLSR